MADFCLMHCSIIARYRRTTLNGKSRPNPDIRGSVCLEIEALKSSRSASTIKLCCGQAAKQGLAVGCSALLSTIITIAFDSTWPFPLRNAK